MDAVEPCSGRKGSGDLVQRGAESRAGNGVELCLAALKVQGAVRMLDAGTGRERSGWRRGLQLIECAKLVAVGGGAIVVAVGYVAGIGMLLQLPLGVYIPGIWIVDSVFDQGEHKVLGVVAAQAAGDAVGIDANFAAVAAVALKKRHSIQNA